MFVFGFDRSFYDVWQFEFENTGAKFWKDLFQEESFNCYIAKRWLELTAVNQPLNYVTISNLIDEYFNLLAESKERELQRWPPQDDWPTVADQEENIIEMKVWIENRINWMNNNIGSSENCEDVSVPSLVISKIHYNPLDDGEYVSEDLEFIEITNNSNQSINLTGYYLRELGISYQFPANASVLSNQKIYLCSNAIAFQNYYGLTPFGVFTRNLSNKSYKIILSDAFGNTIDQVEYKDNTPWPEDADGTGSYLQLVDLNSDNSQAVNWIASMQSLSTENIASSQQELIIYPNPTKGPITIKLNNLKTESLEFIIYNSLGQSIENFKLNSNSLQINLSYLYNGVYYYSIKNKGEVILKNKFIKK